GGDLERGARARRRLEEEVDDGLAAQRRHLLERPVEDLEEGLGEVEDGGDVLGRERLDAEQVPVRGGGHQAGVRARKTTRSSGSPPSRSITRTDSSRVVWMVAPA